jgi:hypothetical protein
VTVVGVDSKLIHDVVSGCVPTQRHGVACCAVDDLVVADSVNSGVVVLSVDSELLASCRYGPLSGVAMHDGTGGVFAMDDRGGSAQFVVMCAESLSTRDIVCCLTRHCNVRL